LDFGVDAPVWVVIPEGQSQLVRGYSGKISLNRDERVAYGAKVIRRVPRNTGVPPRMSGFLIMTPMKGLYHASSQAAFWNLSLKEESGEWLVTSGEWEEKGKTRN